MQITIFKTVWDVNTPFNININKNSLRGDEEKKRIHSIEMKKKRRLGEWGPNGPSYGFKGKTHEC